MLGGDRFGSQNNVINPNGKAKILAAVKLQQGNAVGLTAAGWLGLVTSTGVIKAVGVSDKLYDNTAGASGAFTALYQVGVFPFASGTGVDALTVANLWQEVFFIDANTVGATDGQGTRLSAGILVDFDDFSHPLVQMQPQTTVPDYVPYTWQKTAADGAAATATTEFPLGYASFAGRVGKMVALPAAALTANDATYASIILSKRTQALPGTAVPIASFTTQTTGQALGSGSWVAWTAVIGAAAGTVAGFSQGDMLTLQITKTSTGVVVPITTFEIDLLAA